MLATGLLILKIIGLILLGILGLILGLVLIVLLAPVRYRADASYYGEAKVNASVSWLFHILTCSVVYDGGLDIGIRILGFRIKEKSGAEAGEAETLDVAQEEPVKKEPVEKKAAKDQQKQLEEEILEALEEERPKRKRRFKIPFSFRGICDKLEEIGRQKDKAAAFLKDEENQRTFRLLWRQGKALIRHILPVKLRGKVRFGFDDPYTTGQVLTYISPFYGLYGNTFQVIPVLEGPVLEGEGWLRGRIRIGAILILGARVFFDKNFRKLLRQWRK